MTYRFDYKKVIALLMIVLILVSGLLWYKEQITNKEVPKKASFVINILEWSKVNG